MVIVFMQAEIKKVSRKGNQVVLISEPKRKGLQVITLRYDAETPLKPDEYTLFQLVTPDGYEYDYKVKVFGNHKRKLVKVREPVF